MGPLETTFVASIPTGVVGVLAILYRIGNIVGRIFSRLDELERRVDERDAVKVAERNGYRERPRGH